MRVLRLALAGLLGTAGVLIWAPASYAAGGAHLTAPDRVGPTTAFEMLLTYPRPPSACMGNGKRVVFSWDHQVVATVEPLRLNLSTCDAKVRITPPAGHNAAGRHTVSAVAISPGNPSASRTITVTGAAGDGQDTTAATPAATAPSTAPPAADPAPTESISPVVLAAGGQQPTKNASNTAVNWLLVVGGILVGGGALAFAMLIWRMRQPGLE